jgi:uracil-DNA glycosylase
MLWGAHAQAKRALIGDGPHLILTANHPSPLSARRPPKPFVGCGHFGQAQRWLAEQGVNWRWDLPLSGSRDPVL